MKLRIGDKVHVALDATVVDVTEPFTVGVSFDRLEPTRFWRHEIKLHRKRKRRKGARKRGLQP